MYVCMYVCVCVCVCVFVIINIKVYHKTFPQFRTNYSLHAKKINNTNMLI